MSRWRLYRIQHVLVLVLLPFAIIFGMLAFLRGVLFRLGVFQTFGFPVVRVVSIGNITSGGTGKTPLSLKILAEARRRKRKAAYVSRGFGRKSKGYLEVKIETPSQLSGDEALLIKKTFPEFPVAVCEKRVSAIERLLSLVPEGFLDISHADNETSKTLVIADDCFQHRRLRRDLDVVLVDMTADLWEYIPLPLGLGREGFSSLKRAGAVVLTRCETAGKAEILSMKRRLNLLEVKNVFESRFTINEVYNLSDGKPTVIDGPIYLLSSIAKPRYFKQMAQERHRVLGHTFFSDHFNYREQDLNRVEIDADRVSASRILITEKDAVKVAGVAKDKSRYAVAKLEMTIANEDSFYSMIFNEPRSL